MSGPARQTQEVEALAEAVCRGEMDPERSERLSELLEGDITLCHTYVEKLLVHSALTVYGDDTTVEQMHEKFFAKPHRSGRQHLIIGIVTALACTLMVAIGLTLFSFQAAPPSAGKLIGLTADAKWSGKEYVPGNIILERMSATLETGIATFEMESGAIVSIQGPATIEATLGKETRLISGLLHAVVPEKAIGYIVRTIDAQVTDLGTEFTVERNDEFGTRVAVKKGRVEARTINSSGPGSVHQLTAGRSMEFVVGSDTAKDLAGAGDWGSKFKEFEQARGGIARLDGIVRASPSLPADLRPGQMQTNNYIMLVRECTGILLDQDLTVQQANGPKTIPAGTVIDSYLLHFDPQYFSTLSPIGTIEFNQPIFAIASKSSDLNATDNLCGVNGSLFATDEFRGLEEGIDPVVISADRKTLSFHFSRTPPQELDQCRVFVKHVDEPAASTSAN
ncbi:FecR family protein [Calycomorphotria hydatis]|uniref:FecR protein n=1 Tax=Calycomorphotria hydatis TaxID=2528027 RepID=A0A517TF95_9PLAN|nr:FecR domain-containing protein [Calycomorphotria hydatis]QDT67049.1 FecR protein [Calycomorphotria hydatis]